MENQNVSPEKIFISIGDPFKCGSGKEWQKDFTYNFYLKKAKVIKPNQHVWCGMRTSYGACIAIICTEDFWKYYLEQAKTFDERHFFGIFFPVQWSGRFDQPLGEVLPSFNLNNNPDYGIKTPPKINLFK